MSLQNRIAALVAAVLVVSMVLGATFAGLQARATLRAELQAALVGGAQTVRSAYEDLPRSNHQPRDLLQLVATFDGNRHVSAKLIDGRGAVLAASRTSEVTAAPLWFERLLAPQAATVRLPAPGGGHSPGVIVLSPTPQIDAGAIWLELSGVVTVLSLATLAGLTAVWFVVRAALSPLRELSDRLVDVGQGDYRGRVRERGPAEVLALERSFNAMAEDLTAAGRRNWKLEQQLLTLQDEERAEIARDLHDEVGAQLFAVSLDAQLITQLLASGRPEGVADQVAAIQSGVGHIQREIRGMVARLRPARATELGLGRAVQDLVSFWSARRPEIAFIVDVSSPEQDISDLVADTAFRVVQEAVSNAVRHAHPKTIKISVVRVAAGLNVAVANDGTSGQASRESAGFGLKGMEERVRSTGGTLEIRPATSTDDVWSVAATLPAPAPAGVELVS